MKEGSLFGRFRKYYHADTALRYFPIAREIIKNVKEKDSIAEVGSGVRGITPFIPFKITGADISFSGEIAKNLRPVYLSVNKLPFPDKSFQHVICVDMLEHILPSNRPDMIVEMLRICTNVLYLAVPCGKESEAQDQMHGQAFFEIRGYRDSFLEEHIKNGLPEKTDIIDLISKAANMLNKSIDIKVLPNFNLKLRDFIMRQWMSPILHTNKIYYCFSIILCVLRRWLNFGKCYRQIFYVFIREEKS